MTPNVNYYEMIEDYCLGFLNEGARVDFEAELKLDAELRKEVQLRMEVQSAIAELDVANLREKLKNVAAQNKTRKPDIDSFELLTDFTDFDEINDELSSEELINFFDSMPKVHVHQHELTSDEVIHKFYKEQNEAYSEGIDNDFDEFDIEEFEGLEEAILEKDIIEFRQTLNQVSKTIEPQFTVEEIDNYLNNDLSEEDLKLFETELEGNGALKEELELHDEIDLALNENEILDLRNKLSGIVEKETSWNVTEQEIEEYIDGELSGESLTQFIDELSENTDLMAEVKLRKQVDEVVGENDIMDLREQLDIAKEFAEVSAVRKIVPVSNNRRILKAIKTTAAVAVIAVGIGSFINSGYVSSSKAYENYYESPKWAAERAVNTEYSYLNNVQTKFIDSNFAEVLNLGASAPENVKNSPVFQFYLAASMQNMNMFSEAINSYNKVIEHGDNLFVEEANWYRSLCYIKLGNKDLAKRELIAIIDRNGHYKKDAKAVLRRIRVSLE